MSEEIAEVEVVDEASVSTEDAGHVRTLTMDDIMQAEDVTEREVFIEEWGGNVTVKSLTKRQMDAVRTRSKKGDDIDEMALEKYAFIAGMVEPKISEAEYEQLQDKSFYALARITKEILQTSNMDKDSVKREEKSFRPE